MIIRKKWLHIAVAILLTGFNLSAEPLAFPTAQGFGANASGGRGGTVYHVTTLNENGPGSFKEGVSQPNRTIVFDVGGVIKITDRINVADNITIAGQTAPGDGIAIYGYGIITNGNNIIVRYLNILGSIAMSDGKCAVTWDNSTNVIYDHCTIAWGRWDCIHIANSRNVTMQYCIIGEGIDPQRFGAITDGTRNWTVHHNLWINQKSRNPKMKCHVQYINNVIYNYGCCGIVGGHSAGTNYQDVINNYFIAGPNSSPDGFLSQWDKTDNVYNSGNFVDLDKDGTLNGRAVTNDDFLSAGGDSYGGATIRSTPYLTPPVPVDIESAEDAYTTVMNTAGSSLHRISTDKRFISHLKSLGKEGALIDREADVGGVGTVNGGTPPTDTDRDGIPDAWETAHNLDANAPEDRNGTDLSSEGYTNLEVYLNELVKDNATTAIDSKGTSKEKFGKLDTKSVTLRYVGGELIINAPTEMNADIKAVNAAGRLLWNRSKVKIQKGRSLLSLSKKEKKSFLMGTVIVSIESKTREYRIVVNTKD